MIGHLATRSTLLLGITAAMSPIRTMGDWHYQRLSVIIMLNAVPFWQYFSIGTRALRQV